MPETAGPALRRTNLDKLAATRFDVIVLGGGINGAVSAAALAARGAKVALIDRGDFAGLTSSASSNLAWGGIKYLETLEFGLVHGLCKARNELLRAYPAAVHEIRFFVSHERGFRHGRMKLLAGAWLYWAIGLGFTRRPRLLSVADIAREEPVVAVDRLDGGFEYSDAYFHDNDARFTWGFVRAALDHGCIAANYAEAEGASREGGAWRVPVRDVAGGRRLTVEARALVNACGPHADAVNALAGVRTAHHHVFSKGVHLLVPRVTPSPRVLTFFADDGRLFFVIPMGARTCIGTTDTPVERPEVSVTPEDRRFVLENLDKRLRLARPLSEADILAERCGVRPLVVEASQGIGSDWMQLSRRHVVEVQRDAAHLTIFGGKLTDCLNVGEEVCVELERLGVALPYRDAPWYGEPPRPVRDAYFHQARLMDLDALTAPRASEKLSSRLWRRYGAGAIPMLDLIRTDPRMGEVIIETSEYLRCELAEAAQREMIVKLEDFLRRRSKIALVVPEPEIRAAAGLREAARILFGDAAEARIAEYFEPRGAGGQAA